MTQTILITGASSGIGKATAKHFHAQGWNVIATMRAPEQESELQDDDHMLLARLDVTDSTSIKTAVAAGIERFGHIDVLLNNAGYGAYGPLEASSMDRVRRQFDTNVIGLIETTKAVLPHFRANQSGTIINISSIGGQMTFPLGSLYHGSKFAVEGLSEALHYELEPMGVTVKIIEPGMTQSDFGGRSFDFVNDEALAEYQPVVGAMQRVFGHFAKSLSAPEVIAGVIWRAATDGSKTLRYRAGADAETLLGARKAESDEEFFQRIKDHM